MDRARIDNAAIQQPAEPARSQAVPVYFEDIATQLVHDQDQDERGDPFLRGTDPVLCRPGRGHPERGRQQAARQNSKQYAERA